MLGKLGNTYRTLVCPEVPQLGSDHYQSVIIYRSPYNGSLGGSFVGGLIIECV